MGFLSLGLTFIGYVLVYASVANHGRFAVSPWTGVLADAYTDDTSSTPGTGTPSRPGNAPPGSATPAAPKKKGSGPGIDVPIIPLPIPGIPKIHIPLPDIIP